MRIYSAVQKELLLAEPKLIMTGNDCSNVPLLNILAGSSKVISAGNQVQIVKNRCMLLNYF